MRNYKKFSFKKFFISLMLTICLIITAVFGYIYFRINPILSRVAQVKVENLVVSAVNDAIYKVLKNGTADYNELISVHKDNNGNISLIQANNTKINLIAIETTKQAQHEIDKISNSSIKIQTGSSTGLPVLIGYGSQITINFLSEGNVKCLFRSEFTSVGINQTKHKIYIDVESKIQLVLPIVNKTIITSIPILISENVLIGEVPDVYLGSNLWGNQSNQGNIFVP